MDQFAFHDIPDSIDYILETTFQPSLSYIGFSQGTAQAFATLSIHPTLNDKVDVFIALAPAMSPAGLSNGIVDSLVKASPEVLFLAFGRRSILSSATMWQALLYPPIFTRLIDMSLSFLFGWRTKNISVHQKLAAYPHLYSFSSTKSVVHWFQIIRNRSFQMFDDDVQAPLSLVASERYYKVAKFPTRNIKTPIILVYGGSDSLVDIKVMLKELPRHTLAKEIPHFEHLDFLWAQEVDTLVFPHVFDALEEHAGRDHFQDRPFSQPSPRHTPRKFLSQRPTSSEDELSSFTTDTDANGTRPRSYTTAMRERYISSTSKSHLQDRSPNSASLPDSPDTLVDGTGDSSSPTPTHQPHITSPLKNITKRRNGSQSSARSGDNTNSARRVSNGGISIGAGKATLGGVSKPSASNAK